MQILETKRLVLREFTLEDADLLFQYSQEETAKKELPDEMLESPEEARERIRTFIMKYPKSYPLVYAVELKEVYCLFGHTSLSPIPEGIEVGYAIAANYQGRGYATEIVKPFSLWAKKHTEIHTLYGLAKSSNTASWKVLERSGFQFQREEVRNAWGSQFSFRIYCL